MALSDVGEALAELGDEDLVRTTYDELLEASEARCHARSFDQVRGILALRLGLVDEARVHFQAGVDWAAREGVELEGGRCHQGMADALVALGRKGDAFEHLDQAAALFRSRGAARYLSQVIAKKLELQGVGSGDALTSIDSIATAVQTEHPDLAPQAAPDGTVTLMFSDIIDSTATNERLGDTAWMALLRKHNVVIREQVAANNGYEVKSMGDGFMLAFRSAKDGLNCSIGIQRAIADRNDSAEEAVDVRIGLHTGEAVQEQGDFFGKHVNLAARIGGSATGGEILVSSLLAQLVGPSGEFTLSERPAMSLKGLDGEHVTHGVAWR